MSDWTIVGGYSPVPKTQPAPQPTSQPTASTFENAATWGQHGIVSWMWRNLIYPYMEASSWMANKLGLISDAEREQNRQTIRDVWQQAYVDNDNVDKNSKAYIYANEWIQALWDAAKYMTAAALWRKVLPTRAPVPTTPALANPALPHYTAIIPWANGWYILPY